MEQTEKLRAAVWFWGVILAFAGLWALLPSLLHSGYKPDVIELQLIGKEWVLATKKHPMLPAWILEILNMLTGRSFAAPFIAASLCTTITLFSVWRLASKVLSGRLALTAVFVMLPFWPLTVESTKYNQNSALMACWTLAALLFFNAFQTNQYRYWIAAGIILGLGLHAKYTMILLAVAVLLYSLWIPRFRRYWKEPGPWLTVGLSFVIFLPHLIWLHQTSLESMTHAVGHRYAAGFFETLSLPLIFLGQQLGLLCVAPLIPLIPCLGLRWKKRQILSEIEKETMSYLLFCLIFPLSMILCAALCRINLLPDYGYTLWFFLSVILLLRFQSQNNRITFFRTLLTSSLIVLVMVCAFILQAIASPYLMGTPRKFHFPMRALGAECDRIWSSRYSSPCPYVSGHWIAAGNAAYAMKDRPSVHFYYASIGNKNSQPTGTWSTDAMVNRKGGIILWEAGTQTESDIPDWVHHRFSRAEVLPETLEIPFTTSAEVPPVRIGVAVIPPSH